VVASALATAVRASLATCTVAPRAGSRVRSATAASATARPRRAWTHAPVTHARVILGQLSSVGPMAEEGAPRGAPPPRPASRASSDAGSPPAGDADDATSRAHRRRASTLDAHRDKSADEADAAEVEDGEHANEARERDVSFSSEEEVGGVDDRHDVQMLHDKLLEFRVENDALGEATTALRRALRRATEEIAETRAALATAEAALEGERSASRASRETSEEEAKKTRAELGDVERLALELQGELEEARARAAEEARARRDADNAAAAAREERDAAAAMAESLRDALADAARDAETSKAKTKAFREKQAHTAAKEKAAFEAAALKKAERDAGEKLGEELREARAAAERAAKDRDAMASTWRREWESAKADHASELRSRNARVAHAESELASMRLEVRAERDARVSCEKALAEATLRARDATRDRDGAVASLRALAEHEDATRDDHSRRAAVVGRLRDDAAEAASRCEALAERCASLIRERDAAEERAERAEADLREMAEVAESVAAAQTESARRRAERAAFSESSPERSSPETTPASALLRAAVRESGRSPNAFAASMASRRRRGAPRGDDGPSFAPPASSASARSAPDPSTPATPETPDLRAEGVPNASEAPRSRDREAKSSPSRWIHAVGDAVAEELVHALAREVAELRDAAASLRADAADARAARDDARRALLEETTRARSLERARVLDLRETRAAEGRALEAAKTAWALRDKLALAAVVTTIHRNDGAPNSDVDAERPSSFCRENDDDDDDDDVEVEDLPVEREAKKKDAEAPASAFFQNAGARAFSFTGFRSAEDETLISTQFLAPSTPDDGERFAQRGPSPRAARAPRPTAFSPM